jgi:large subunit ribosomal protein L23
VENYNVIIRPLVTEQGMHFANVKNTYSFEVHKHANKAQIKNAIEKIYKVKVDEVRTANRKGKPRRRGRIISKTADWKKAVIVLKPEYHIDLF